MLEDKHCQVILKNEDDTVNNILMDYDIILRTNDRRTSYDYFDIYDYKNHNIVASGIEIKKKARNKNENKKSNRSATTLCG